MRSRRPKKKKGTSEEEETDIYPMRYRSNREKKRVCGKRKNHYYISERVEDDSRGPCVKGI